MMINLNGVACGITLWKTHPEPRLVTLQEAGVLSALPPRPVATAFPQLSLYKRSGLQTVFPSPLPPPIRSIALPQRYPSCSPSYSWRFLPSCLISTLGADAFLRTSDADSQHLAASPLSSRRWKRLSLLFVSGQLPQAPHFFRETSHNVW